MPLAPWLWLPLGNQILGEALHLVGEGGAERTLPVLVGRGQNVILIVPLKVMSGFRPLIKESRGTTEERG